MIKVYNQKANKVEEVDDGAIQQLVDSGEYALLKGQELEFEDTEGQRRIVPSEQFYDAVDAGFRHIPTKQIQREKLVEEAGDEPLKAAAVGALRGLTMGLSDQILTSTGITTPEKLSALEEGNPIITPTFEIAGEVAPLFVSPGTAAGKLLGATPAGLAEKLATAAATKAAPLSGKILAKTTSNVTKEVVEAAVKYGTGSAVEGALFGAGNLISEDALGDAEFNAETALAAMGQNALLGGAFGSVAGASAKMIGVGAKGVVNKYNEVRQKVINSIEDPVARKDVLTKLSNQEAAEEILGKLGKDSDEIAEKLELQRSAERLGVPLTPGMKEGGVFSRLEGSLVKEPSLGGLLTRKEVEKTYKATEDIQNLILKDAADVDARTVGQTVRNNVKAKISEELEPASLLYQELSERTADLPITESLKNRFKTTLQKNEFVSIYDQGRKLIDNLDNLNTYADVTNYRTFIGKEMKKAQRAGDDNAIDFLGEMYDNLTTMRQNAIKYNLKARPFVSKNTQITDLLEAQLTADKMYRETHVKYGFLNDFLGVKSKNMQNLVDALDDVDDKVLAEKAMSMRDLKKLEEFQRYFPEAADLARAKKLNELKNKSTSEGKFSPKKFKTILSKLDDTELKILAPHLTNPKQIVADYSRIVDALPPNIGPSGTPEALSFQNMFQIPYQAREAVRYAAYKSGPNSVLNKIMFGLPVNGAIEKAANRGKIEISSAVESFFKKSADRSIKSINRIITGQDMTQDDVKEIEKKIELYQQAPDQVVEHFVRNNKPLLKSAPNTAANLQGKIFEAANFLSSKVPKKQYSIFNDQTPSRSQMMKFKNYVDAVENPYGVLKTIASGYVAPEYMEAFGVVYPKMAQALREEFIGRVNEFKNITEKQKAELTRILGIDSRKAYTPAGFAILQQASAKGVQEDLQNTMPKKVPVSAGKEIKASNRAQSGLDRVLYRS